jgi:hypothetical protein
MTTKRQSSQIEGEELDDSDVKGAIDGKELDEKKEIGGRKWEVLYADRAQTFVKSLMNAKYEDIPNSIGMKVLRDIIDLESGRKRTIVVRTITKDFWNECIKVVDTDTAFYRVAAIGTPGIGKTTSTAILIRMLLERKKTVVYLIRSKEKKRWYYEFVPNTFNSSITAKVYREYLGEDDILSLQEQSTYYIVDPGETKDSCDPPVDFLPKYILITSPDERHWGESEFEKERNGSEGWFKIYPSWSLEELLLARNQFKGDLAEEFIYERYRLFGGVPRNVFVSETKLSDRLKKQMASILKISETHVKDIVLGQMDVVGNFATNAPKGDLLGFNSTREDFGRSEMDIFLLSSAIAEKVHSMHISTLWNIMISSDPVIQRTLFEPYIRSLLTDKTKQNVSFDMQSLVTQQPVQRELQICKSIKLVLRLTEQALTPLVLYHSVIQNHPLIDCLYKDDSGLINAIKITTGVKHSMNHEKIRNLHRAVGIENTLNLYYFVPTDNYNTFKTNPVLPTYVHDNFGVYFVSVPDPSKT